MSEIGVANTENTVKKEVEKPRLLLRYPASGTIMVEVPNGREKESPAQMIERIRESRKFGRYASAGNENVSLAVTSQPPKDVIIRIPVTIDRVKYFKPSRPSAKKHETTMANSVWLEEIKNPTEAQLEQLRKDRKLIELGDMPLTKDVREKIAPLLEKDTAKV